MSESIKGKVKWFNDAKGFGFIEHTSGKDVFVHYSVIEVDGFKTLKDGEEVVYEMKEGPKGLQAVKVQRSGQPSDGEMADGEMADGESASETAVVASPESMSSNNPLEQEEEADLDD